MKEAEKKETTCSGADSVEKSVWMHSQNWEWWVWDVMHSSDKNLFPNNINMIFVCYFCPDISHLTSSNAELWSMSHVMWRKRWRKCNIQIWFSSTNQTFCFGWKDWNWVVQTAVKFLKFGLNLPAKETINWAEKAWQ